MADPDQFIKDLFLEQTAQVTAQRVRFEVPAEVTARALTPDGLLTRAEQSAELSALPAPLCRLPREAVADFKMPGDHTDRSALARAKLRRDLRWVTRLEAAKPADAATLDPRDSSTWVVAPHFPRWIEVDAKRGLITAEDVGDGCKRLGALDHDVLWVAANELPLRVELLPFLFVRSGQALVKLIAWLPTVKEVAWVVKVLHSLPMDPELYEQVRVPRDPEEQRRIHEHFFEHWLSLVPEAKRKILEEGRRDGRLEGLRDGRLEGLRHRFERRLKRPLSPAEQALLEQRAFTLGADRLDDVVLDLDSDGVAAWLADPVAR